MCGRREGDTCRNEAENEEAVNDFGGQVDTRVKDRPRLGEEAMKPRAPNAAFEQLRP